MKPTAEVAIRPAYDDPSRPWRPPTCQRRRAALIRWRGRPLLVPASLRRRIRVRSFRATLCLRVSRRGPVPSSCVRAASFPLRFYDRLCDIRVRTLPVFSCLLPELCALEARPASLLRPPWHQLCLLPDARLLLACVEP